MWEKKDLKLYFVFLSTAPLNTIKFRELVRKLRTWVRQVENMNPSGASNEDIVSYDYRILILIMLKFLIPI